MGASVATHTPWFMPFWQSQKNALLYRAQDLCLVTARYGLLARQDIPTRRVLYGFQKTLQMWFRNSLTIEILNLFFHSVTFTHWTSSYDDLTLLLLSWAVMWPCLHDYSHWISIARRRASWMTSSIGDPKPWKKVKTTRKGLKFYLWPRIL